MISMQYMHPRNRNLKRDGFSPSKFNTRPRPPSSFTPKGIESRVFENGKMKSSKKQAPTKPTFPEMVHQILEDAAREGHDSIVGWEKDGSSFHINEPHLFNDTILPRYSNKKTKFRSFQRQLNIYGFKMTKKSGVYRHQLFRRGHMQSIRRIRPRATPSKKRDYPDGSEKKTKRRSTYVPSALRLGDQVDDGDEFQTNSPRECNELVTTPLLRSISMENGELEEAAQQVTNDGDDHGMWLCSIGFDEDPAICSGCSNGACAAPLEQNHISCPTTFDLFDDMDGITLCSCNGLGCCFTKIPEKVEEV